MHLHLRPEAAEATIALLLEQGVVMGLNASGGHPGIGLEASIQASAATAGRIRPYCSVVLDQVQRPDWPHYVTQTLERCQRLGAVGVKISKYLGLGVRGPDGTLLAVDSPLLDPLFIKAGRLGLPVLIHSGDPKAFFQPNTPDNERFAELSAHPAWSFHGKAPWGQAWPKWHEVLEQFERRVARHPETTFVGTHFGNAAEEPERVAAMLRRYPNYFIDTAARVPEFGRHPAAQMRAFFMEFQDRVLFGSDMGVTRGGLVLGSSGRQLGNAADARVFFDAHWRYFETEDRQMPHPTPIQGDWRVDGVDLPRPVLEKLYFRNAARVFDLEVRAVSSEEASK